MSLLFSLASHITAPRSSVLTLCNSVHRLWSMRSTLEALYSSEKHTTCCCRLVLLHLLDVESCQHAIFFKTVDYTLIQKALNHKNTQYTMLPLLENQILEKHINLLMTQKRNAMQMQMHAFMQISIWIKTCLDVY